MAVGLVALGLRLDILVPAQIRPNFVLSDTREDIAIT